MDLLTVEEEADRRNVFDIPLLGSRLQRATEWLASNPQTSKLVPGYFGARSAHEINNLSRINY